MKPEMDQFVNYSTDPVEVIHSLGPSEIEDCVNIPLPEINSYRLFRTNPFLANPPEWELDRMFVSKKVFKQAQNNWKK